MPRLHRTSRPLPALPPHLDGRTEWEAALYAAGPQPASVCTYCGAPSAIPFCSDECEQLSEWERPGSTDAVSDRFNAFHTVIDTASFALLVGGALSLLAL